MGIDAKKIQVCVLMVIRFSINICSRFIQKHPLISGVLAFLFLLYWFLPKAFFFLIYSSPFLACTYVFIRFYWLPQKPKTEKNDVKDESKVDAAPPGKVRKKEGKSVRRTYTSARNFEVKKSENPDDDPVRIEQITEEKKDSSSCSRNVSVDEITSLTRMEENNIKSDGGGKTEIESLSSEEEEAKEGRIKAVEWTEDDQKNLMDLGFSELERNKRLENLIERRRARKLYKMQTDKYLISNASTRASTPMAPVLITRSNTFDFTNASDEQIPGSAPSILSHKQNPFDLPYDPLEEKPNLTADNFHQEFMESQQREMLFCRHESFSLGSSFALQGKLNETDIAGQSRFKSQIGTGDPDCVTEDSQVQGGEGIHRTLSATDLVTEEDETSNEVQIQPEEEKQVENTVTESNISKESETQEGTMQEINHNKGEPSSSSASVENESPIKDNKSPGLTNIKPPVFRFPDAGTSPNENSGPCPLPKARVVNEISYIASPSTIDRSSLENHLLYTNNGLWHTPAGSVGSDMQVEVSEVGSPPLTGDGSASSNDGDSLTYDGDIEKEITSGSDDMWGISPHAPKVGLDQLLTELNEFNESNIPRDFSGYQQRPEDPIPSSSIIHLPQQDQNLSVNNDHEIPNDGERAGNDLEDSDPRESSRERSSLQDTSISSTSPQEDHLQKPQETMSSSEKPAVAVDIGYVDVPVHTIDHLGDENSVKITPSLPEVAPDLPEPADETDSQSSNHIPEVSVAYTADVLIRKNDHLGDQETVEITHSVSEIVPELADEINSESSNQIESKSPNSPENITRAADFPIHANDDLGDHELVGDGVPGTSIIPEVAHDLSEPSDNINLESRNQIERNSPKSLGRSTEELSIAYTEDVPDDLKDQQLDEVTHGVPETLMAGDKSQMAVEINSECSDHIESNPLSSPDQQSVEDVCNMPETSIISEGSHDFSMLVEEINSDYQRHIENSSSNTPEQSAAEVNVASSTDNPVDKSSEQEVHYLSETDEKSKQNSSGDIAPEASNLDNVTEQEVSSDLSRRAEEETSESGWNNEREHVKSSDNQTNADLARPTIEDENSNGNKESSKPPEDGKQEQSIREIEVSAINPNSDDPSISGIHQELTVDLESSVLSSSSSPKSFLTDHVPLPPTSLDLNQHRHADVSGSNVEESTLGDMSSEQLPQDPALTQNEQHMTADLAYHSSIESKAPNFEVRKGNSDAEVEFDYLTEDKEVGRPSKPADETE